MVNALAQFKVGRIALHLACLARKTNWTWHMRGMWREIAGTYTDIATEAKSFLKELGKL